MNTKLVSLLLLAASAIPVAQAQPVNLTCIYIEGRQDSMRLTFDESAGTAVFGPDPVSHAKFSDRTINWGEVSFQLGDMHYHNNYSFDRETGVLSYYGAEMEEGSERWRNRSGALRCKIAEKVF